MAGLLQSVKRFCLGLLGRKPKAAEPDLVASITASGGYVSPKLDLFHEMEPGGERGVFAMQDIAEGEQLFLIPVSSTIYMDRSVAGADDAAP